MGTFDSTIRNSGEAATTVADTRAVLPDLSRLTAAENSAISKTKNSIVDDLEIAAIPIAATTVAGGLVGGAYGLTAEAAVQVYKVPVALGLGAFGAPKMAMDLLNSESRYMSTAGHYGSKGVLIGAGIGLLAFGAYEVKNYFEK